ncbi:carboxypeptidase [Oceanobacillus iheyensis HTE831]|uniref:Carboxypeptidase n=1 Tax=Oceanobacillus iheyensis (strain DSM 14371 / CIP 107618 / JCM 11309 / KCTC 3954 / HTE831) TaxID=221109 RepID=Q8ENA3_OCEIH|nr:M20 family metallopeptidase [Oceanobacillus iheyensis]BAC14540.1 carboxypeptidase [Oceanobacillus iheyensis HTE831]
MIDINQQLSDLTDEIISNRRFLHENPELSHNEKETSAFVQRKLHEYGINFEADFSGYAVLGIIKGNKPGKTVALRADMDALPIQEETDVSFKSKKADIMHACGHDAHTAMLLGAGYILKQMQKDLEGTILLVFQPAEEDAPIGGSQAMIDSGVFSTYEPDVIFAQHVWPFLKPGLVGVHDKEVMGASDRFKITLEGKGGHASMPHQTSDAVIAAGHLITSLQTIVSRNLDPMEASVVTISMLEAGSVPNIIPKTVTLQGSIRTFQPHIQKRLKERFFAITNQIAEAFGTKAEIDYQEGYPATINTPKWAEIARRSAQTVYGESATPDLNPALAGEDFGRFLQKYPGAFIWLGTQIENENEQAPLHDSKFQIDERALPKGTKLLVQLALDALKELKQEEDYV